MVYFADVFARGGCHVKGSVASADESSKEASSSEVTSSSTTSVKLLRYPTPQWVSSVGSLGSMCSAPSTPWVSQLSLKRPLSIKVSSWGHSWLQRISGPCTLGWSSSLEKPQFSQLAKPSLPTVNQWPRQMIHPQEVWQALYLPANKNYFAENSRDYDFSLCIQSQV